VKLTQKIRDDAGQTYTMSDADDIASLTSNMLYLIARAMLKEHGWYSCTIGGKKTLFVVEK